MAEHARVEWPTLGLIAMCYALWARATTWLAALWLPAAVAVAAIAIAFHASLMHEAIHGHPTRHARLNAALVLPALGLVVPYARFRDTHLAHHRDAVLTDPYDDPESAYLERAVWGRLPRAARAVLRLNNTLAGRLILGPAISVPVWLAQDARAILAGERRVITAWAWHLPALGMVAAWLARAGAMPLPAYLLAAYVGLSLLKLRTYLEHRAHEHSAARSVVVEDRGPLALLFLNNNLHLVHHMHPDVAWYRLPALYAANRARYLSRNGGYRFRSYAQVIARYLLRAKEPVAHPFLPRR